MAGREVTPERIAGLPAWAQRHVQFLERQVEDANRELALIRDGQITDQMRAAFPGTRVRAVRDPYGTAMPVAVTRHDSVRWFPYPGREDSWIETRMREDGELELSVSGTVVIRSQAANVVRVQTERF